MTMHPKSIMKTAAASRRKRRAARKEGDMSPTLPTATLRLPPGWLLEPREGCQPRADERPLLRDDAGHVMAEVERWYPDLTN